MVIWWSLQLLLIYIWTVVIAAAADIHMVVTERSTAWGAGRLVPASV
jgi:hypothetical protein